MGAACCCLRTEDLDELAYPNRSIYRHCICLRCFIQLLLHVYNSVVQQGEFRALSSSTQGETSLSGSGLASASVDNSLADIYRAPPRPLSYEADSRYSLLQRGLVSRREKASSHLHEESETLRRSSSSNGMESMPEKGNLQEHEGHSKIGRSESYGKLLLAKVTNGISYMFPSTEDEDVCPTCLEEYTPDDPKIVTQCSHHFHLGCIYEWMERSDSCPVCGKEMVFSESP